MSARLRYVFALPVWGDWYREFFLEVSLPSLLSPGNLPAFATPATFTAMLYTRPQDLPLFGVHPAIRRLREIADVRFKALPEDIPEFGTAADGILRKLTVMSRCMEVAIRAAEEDDGLVALFPLADLVYGDGSMAAVDRRMRDGCQAVGVATPHAVAEAARADSSGLLEQAAAGSRSLLGWTLANAHPSFTGQFLDSRPFSGRPSQFYASGGDDGFAGRAIHLHPLAVRPTVRVNTLAASIDTAYFFDAVPAADLRHVVGDSDEALVVECSRHDYLSDLADWPAFTPAAMAEWIGRLKLSPGQADLLEHDLRFRLGDGDGLDRAGAALSRTVSAIRQYPQAPR